jgi:hypothetical protein
MGVTGVVSEQARAGSRLARIRNLKPVSFMEISSSPTIKH